MSSKRYLTNDDRESATKRQRLSSIPPNVGSNPLPFAKYLRREQKRGIIALTTAYKNLYMSCDPSKHDCFPWSYQYIQSRKDIDRLYGTSVGNVFVFGSQEFNLLKLHSDDEEAGSSVPMTRHVFFDDKKIRQVACAGFHSLALSTDGRVYSWGIGDDGELGREEENMIDIIPSLRNIIQISAGNTFSLFLDKNGDVFMCGMFRDVEDTRFSVPIVTDGVEDPVGWRKTPVRVRNMPGKVRQIQASVSGNFYAAVLQDDTIVTAGFGCNGELARSRDMANPNQDGEYDLGRQFYYTTPVTKLDGNKTEYTVMEPNIQTVCELFLKPQPVRWAGNLPFPKKIIVSVACGSRHLLVAARDHDGSPYGYSAGLNRDGQLGHGDFVERHELTRIPSLENVHQVAAGVFHSLALCRSGQELYSFGRGNDGVLGLGGSEKAVPLPSRVAFPSYVIIREIVCGDFHNMALAVDGQLYTWGSGQMLATGHAKNCVGKKNGDILRPTALPLPGEAVETIGLAAGAHHSIILLNDD